MGIDPYPAELFPVSDYSIDIKNEFKIDEKVVIAGRLMSRRIQGMQVLLSFKIVKEKYNSILTEMKSALITIKLITMNFIKNY